MEAAILDLERKIKVLQALVENTRDEKQKAMFQRSLQNARQVLANLQEINRIVNGGDAR
jgi:hypothetical protein